MKLPHWLLNRIDKIPHYFRGKLVVEIADGGVSDAYVTEKVGKSKNNRLDKDKSYSIDLESKVKKLGEKAIGS